MKTTLLKTLSILCVTFGLVTALPTPASAQSAEEIMKRAKEIKDLKDLLNNADATVRIAALEAMLSSEDFATRELGYSAGFSSIDDAMRAVTLRKKLSEVSELTINLLIPEESEEEYKGYLERFGKSRTLRIRNFNLDNGNFGAYFRHYRESSEGTGSVSGLRLDATQDDCFLGASLNDESVLEGTFTCSEREYRGVTVPVKIHVF